MSASFRCRKPSRQMSVRVPLRDLNRIRRCYIRRGISLDCKVCSEKTQTWVSSVQHRFLIRSELRNRLRIQEKATLDALPSMSHRCSADICTQPGHVMCNPQRDAAPSSRRRAGELQKNRWRKLKPFTSLDAAEVNPQLSAACCLAHLHPSTA